MSKAEFRQRPTLFSSQGPLGRWLQHCDTRYRALFLVVFAVACLVRIIVAARLSDFNPATANLWEYGSVALKSMGRGGITWQVLRPDGSLFIYPTAFVPPLPIFLWMGVFALFGVTKSALIVMVIFNLVCSCLIVLYTMRIATTLFGSAAISLLAGVFVALYPEFVYSVATYHAVNFYLVFLLAIFDLSSSRYRPSVGLSVVIGVLLGAAALTRTEYLLLGAAIVGAATLNHRRWLLGVLTMAIAIATISPWTVRNYVVFHRVVPVANSVGYNLFKGFNTEANGSGHWVDSNGVIQRQLGAALAAVPIQGQDFEIKLEDVFQAAAMKAIWAHPVRAFVTLPIRKILLFWMFDVYDPTTHLFAYQLAFWPTFGLTVVGVVFSIRRGLWRDPDHALVLWMFAMETFVMAAYAVHARYRMNAEPFLFAYSAAGVLVLLARSRLGTDAGAALLRSRRQ